MKKYIFTFTILTSILTGQTFADEIPTKCQTEGQAAYRAIVHARDHLNEAADKEIDRTQKILLESAASDLKVARNFVWNKLLSEDCQNH